MLFKSPIIGWVSLILFSSFMVTFDKIVMALHVHQQLPQLYYGFGTRNAKPLRSGLVWSVASWDKFKLKHDCNMDDDFKYTYNRNGGKFLMNQTFYDTPWTITTTHLNIPDSKNFILKISGKRDAGSNDALVLFYYIANSEGQLKMIDIEEEKDNDDNQDNGKSQIISGHHSSIGKFSLQYFSKGDTSSLGLPVPSENIWQVKDIANSLFQRNFQAKATASQGSSIADRLVLDSIDSDNSNLYAFQKVIEEDEFEIYAVLLSEEDEGEEYIKEKTGLNYKDKKFEPYVEAAAQNFDARFETVFNLEKKGYDKNMVKFGRDVLSNLLGGVGFFHGKVIVDRSLEDIAEDNLVDYEAEEEDDYFDDGGSTKRKVNGPNPQEEGPFSLLTGTPSRSFFPRGFLWDEGFHQLLIGAWDSDLSLTIFESWMDMMDEKGWIAREQILGEEARSKVPEKFRVQYPHFANPPTIMFALSRLSSQLEIIHNLENNLGISQDKDDTTKSLEILLEKQTFLSNMTALNDYMNRIYPKIKLRYNWFRRTQWGELSWGRDKVATEGYRWRGRTQGHTLTSGLDDYPRASPPHDGELHLDLLCWMGYQAKYLKEIAETLSLTDDAKEYEKQYNNMKETLEKLHWNEKEKVYTDLTVDKDGKSTHVTHKGYISLFPLMLNMADPSSQRASAILDLISDPKHLWSNYGLRSLSKSDSLYRKGEDYWRGPIWININYLVLASLYNNYIHTPGPNQEKATKIYTELRKNIIDMVHKQYEITGFFWEQYDPETGKGRRSHPFTGWTSLVLLIMSENYCRV